MREQDSEAKAPDEKGLGGVDPSEPGPGQDCLAVAERLGELSGGVLDQESGDEVRRHLAACSRCREEEASLRQLLVKVEALPASVSPPRDLWPDIVARLPEREPLIEEAAPVRSTAFHPWARALAAVLLVALGALMSLIFRPPVPGEATVGSEAPGSQAKLASVQGEKGSELRLGEEFQQVEADLLRAKDRLRQLASAEVSATSRNTRKVLERNLAIIEEAITEVRQALEDDPGNPRLRQQLLAHHRRGIDLLRRLGPVGEDAA